MECAESLELQGWAVRKGNFMKKILSFGIAAAALAAFFVSCSNGGGSSGADDGASEASGFAVGKEISYDGDSYLVLKNDFAENSGRSSRAVVESYSGLFYQNENAEKVRREKIENEFNISKYVELFSVTTKCEKSTAGQSSLSDCYLILNEKGQKMYRLRQVWQSTSMFPEIKGTDEKTAAFNKLDENLLREYDPDYFKIESYSAVYGDDLSKKIMDEYRYKRNSDGDGKTVDYETLKQHLSSKDFIEMSDKKLKACYRTLEDFETGKFCYSLLDAKSTSSFCELQVRGNGNYGFYVRGDGKIGGSTNDSLYKCWLSVRNIDSSSLQYRAKITNNDNTTDSKYITFDYATGKSDYISVSSDKTTFDVLGENVEVPASVTIKALYSDQSAPLQNYAAVSFKPKLGDEGEIVYKPDVDEFIENYKKNFKALYDESKK